ncbi:MAG: Flp pilus assembly complex ATPase component TadA [Phycisphaerales bacterium]|nr:MAG: Flp pilus assembly complex ATPase component TadA [Phycisphaerales bacterium]
MSDSRETEPSRGIVRLVSDVIARSLAAGASDIHFEPLADRLLVRIRVDGRLADFEGIPAAIAENVIARLKVMAGLLTYRVDIPQEGSLRWQPEGDGAGTGPTDLRVATFPTIRGERAVVRAFGARAPVETLDQLGLAPRQVDQLRWATSLPSGLVPITGPAGSGKTTTLYAMVRHIVQTTPDRSIVTLEDPVEQRIDRVAQIQINPYGELNYERCLRSLLRQDPQTILLGEIRDAATASVAVEASLTGHLILTTMHSGDPAEAIVRLLEMGIAAYQVVSSVVMVCSQRLLRRAQTGQHGEDERSAHRQFGPGGRYVGRVACAQIARIDETVRELILAHPSVSRLRQAIAGQGPDLYQRACELADQCVTDTDEVRRILGEPLET